MTEIRSIRPRIQFWNDQFEGKDITESIKMVETSKSINDFAGTFTINLKPNPGMFGRSDNYWYDRFDPMDVVGITFDTARNKDDSGKDRGAQFLGIVDDPHNNVNYANDNPGRGVTITGRDFGMILIDDNIGFFREIFLSDSLADVAPCYSGIEKLIASELKGRHPVFTPNCLNGIGPTMGTVGEKTIFSFTDAKIIDAAKFIMDNATSIRNLVYKIGSKGSSDKTIIRTLINFSKYLLQRDGNVCLPLSGLSTYQGNLLNFIREVVDNDFYEIWVDTKDGVSYLRMRPKPFDRIGDIVGELTITKDDPFCWDNLRTFTTDERYHEISKTETLSTDLYRTKKDIFSIFRIKPDWWKDFSKSFDAVPVLTRVDLYNMLRFGFNVVTANVRTNLSGKKDNLLLEFYAECRDRLKNWNLYKPIYEQGQIVVRGNEKYHIGDKIFLPWYNRNFITRHGMNVEKVTKCEGFYFYVTGVKQHWEPGTAFQTVLTIERGQNDKMIAEYEKERQAILTYVANNVESLYPIMENFK